LVEAQKDAVPVAQSISVDEHSETKTSQVPVIRIMLNGAISATAIGVYPAWMQKLLRYLPWNIVGFIEQLNLVKLTVRALNARLKNGP
jgi:hypothetical protein